MFSIISSEFSQETVEQDLSALIGEDNLNLHPTILQMPSALKAANVLVTVSPFSPFLSHLQNLHLCNGSLVGHYGLESYSISDYMRLDSSALTTLNIFPLDKSHDSTSRFFFASFSFHPSLFGLLNHTLTAGMGERLLRRWLCQPLISVDRINARLDLVELFLNDVSLRNELRLGCLKGLVDVEKLAQRLERRVRFRLQDLYMLNQGVSKLNRILVAR